LLYGTHKELKTVWHNGNIQRVASRRGKHDGETSSLTIRLASVARNCTNAISTNTLVYAPDLRDPVKQNKAVSLTRFAD
jgi:hypothetical protein